MPWHIETAPLVFLDKILFVTRECLKKYPIGLIKFIKNMVSRLISLFHKLKQFLKLRYELSKIRSSGLFDEDFYLAHNPDVALAKVDPLLHYLRYGGFEGRDPGPNFWSAWYLEIYDDVKRAGINPLVHNLRQARKGLMAKPQNNRIHKPAVHRPEKRMISLAKRETFNMFWHGDNLSPLELSCMQSFLNQGHTLRVFTYRGIQLPEGAINEDAEQIIPFNQFFVFEGSPAPFADIFRYKLLLEQGGWWVDTDVVCLRSDIPFCDYFWAEEDPGSLNNAILKFPVRDPLCERLFHLSMERSKNLTQWGQLGPNLLTEVVAGKKPLNHLGSTHDAYPIGWIETYFFWLPEFSAAVEVRSSGSIFIHLWRKMFDFFGIDLNCTPPRGSFIEMLYFGHRQMPPTKPEDALMTRRSIAWYLRQEWAVKYLSDRMGTDISYAIPREY